MNSPNQKYKAEFEATIGAELRAWGARQKAPANRRENLLKAAAAQDKKMACQNGKASQPLLNQFQKWLSPRTRRQPELPQTELSMWLFSQAMWQNLGNDRRAVRFVC